MNHTKHLSFLFTVPLEFYNEWADVKVQHEINVRYTLNWKKEIELLDYNVKLGMAKFMKNWEQLEEQMLEAAKNNSESYRAPGPRGYYRTPYNNMYNEAANNMMREERIK